MVFTGALLTNLYFYLLYCVYVFRWQHVLIGVFGELLTIPAMVALPVFAVLLVLRFVQGGLSSRQLLLGSLLLASTVFVGVMAVLV